MAYVSASHAHESKGHKGFFIARAMSTEHRFHPASMIFPMMSEDESDGLTEDIRANGLLEPIVLHEGMILDGRNRLTCCRLAGVEPTFTQFKGDDPVAFVLSHNLHRRHLTPSQKSMVAARARDVYDAQAKERQRLSEGRGKKGPANLPDLNDTGDARDKAGKAVGVSGRSVDFATKVLNNGTPELIKAVDEGRMAVSTAAVYASEPEEVQREVATHPKRNRKYTPGPNGAGEPESREPTPEPEPGKSRGKGVALANEAIDCLKRIPKNDPLRKRGFQIVTDWIRQNK